MSSRLLVSVKQMQNLVWVEWNSSGVKKIVGVEQSLGSKKDKNVTGAKYQ